MGPCSRVASALLLFSFVGHVCTLSVASLESDALTSVGAPRPFKIDWPFLDAASDIDAWVWMMNERRPDSNMYHPMMLTVGEALHGMGANVAVVAEQTSDAMLANVTAAIGRGCKPLIIAVAFHYASPTGGKRILKQCSDLGAFVVLYQTEPIEQNAHLGEYVELFKPKEVWDYSHKNRDWYPESAQSLYRYVPPGYAKGLDLGVKLSSLEPGRVHGAAHIGFLGGWKFRSREVTDMYHEVFEGKLVSRDDVWTKEQTVEFLTDYPIQLNTHKEENCCPSTNPVEAFRMAQIVSNRACVISARSDPRDELEWQGIVHFAESREMPQVFQKLSADVRGCQASSFEKFKNHFNPAAILRRSGFLDVWRPGKH